MTTSFVDQRPPGGARPRITIAMASGAVAAAAWLWPATVEIAAWPASGPHRIAVFAPLYRLWFIAAAVVVLAGLGVIAASRANVSRRLASIVAPLNLLWVWTVPYWPWLPDRLPLLVALAGPLRLGFAALAIAGVAARALSLSAPRLPLPGRRTAFAAALAVYVFFGLRSLSTIGLSGDEPHYLVITHSLLVDRDLRIENNHTRGDYRAFFGGDLRPDYMMRGVDGEIYSIHAPGLPVLLLPGYALRGAAGAVVTMCLLAALASLGVFDLAALVASPHVAWLTWAAVSLGVPFVPHAWALYPEIAAAAIVGWALMWSVEDRRASILKWLWRGICLAWLPWLHTKFAILLAGVTLLLLWRLRKRPQDALALLLPIAMSGAAWLAFFRVIYGTFDPQAPYGSYTAQFVKLENVPRGLFGLLLDQKFGLLVYAPIYAWCAWGLTGALRDRRRLAVLSAAALGVAYAVSSAELFMWWGGSSPPARFLVPVVPLVVPLLAIGIERTRSRAALTTLALAAACTIAVGVGGALGTSDMLLYSPPHGIARMLEAFQGSSPLAAAAPTFTQEDWTTPARALAPWLVALAAAIAAGWLSARAGWAPLWIATSELAAFAAGVAILMPTFAANVRADSQLRGNLALFDRFDPVRSRAFDYARLARMSPQEWLGQLSLTVDHEPGSDPDVQGRLTDALHLPPGRYESRVWFEGARSQPGAFQAAVGNGYVLGRVDGPLDNPATLAFSMPIAVPSLWMQLTDQSSARAVRRLQLVALDVLPASERPPGKAVTVEALSDRPNAYLAYMDDNAFPERGVFWTRGLARTRVELAPAGAQTVVLTLHVGPRKTGVSLRLGDRTDMLTLQADETRALRFMLRAGILSVPLVVQASAMFRPADVDRSATDTRELGCQVRVELE